MCEPRNRDNGASDLWTLTAYYSRSFPCLLFTFVSFPPLFIHLFCFLFFFLCYTNKDSQDLRPPPPPPLPENTGYLCSIPITWTPLSREKDIPPIRVLVAIVGNYIKSSRDDTKNTPFPEKMGTRMRPPYAFGGGGGGLRQGVCFIGVTKCRDVHIFLHGQSRNYYKEGVYSYMSLWLNSQLTGTKRIHAHEPLPPPPPALQ